MNSILLDSTTLLLDEFPQHLYLLEHKPTNRHGCYIHEGVHGVACFSNKVNAIKFGEWIDLTNLSPTELDFDQAREVAKSKPRPISSIILLDDMKNPIVHYIR